jgi:hypothetical protein
MSALSESSTGQWTRFHGNYWTDRRPVDMAVRLLNRVIQPVDGNSAPVDVPDEETFRRLRLCRAVAFLISTFLLIAVVVVRLPYIIVRAAGVERAAASRFASAKSTIHERSVARYREGSQGGYWIHLIGGAFDLEICGKYPDPIDQRTLNPYLINVQALCDVVRARGKRVGVFNRKPIYELPVEIASLPDDPLTFSILTPKLPSPSVFTAAAPLFTIAGLFGLMWWMRRFIASVVTITMGFFFGREVIDTIEGWGLRPKGLLSRSLRGFYRPRA